MTKRSTKTPAAPKAAAPAKAEAASGPGGKLGILINLLRAPAGTTIPDMMTATGWQAHSIRGVMAGALKKKHGLAIASEKIDGERRYRIPEGATA